MDHIIAGEGEDAVPVKRRRGSDRTSRDEQGCPVPPLAVVSGERSGAEDAFW